MPALHVRRRVGEAVVIGPDVRVEVQHIQDARYGSEGWVELRIEAPRDVLILREELVEAQK